MAFWGVGDTYSAQMLQVFHEELPEESRKEGRLL